MRTNIEKELTLVEFFNQFKQFADSKTAYKSAKKLFADCVNQASYFLDNREIILDASNYRTKVIATHGGYFAVHVVNDENAGVRWHDFNFRAWHVGIFAKTRHGLTLVGVVSNVDGETFTWWANCHGKFYAAIYSVDSYSAPDDDGVLRYHGSYRDFLNCIGDAVAFLTEDAVAK